MNEVHDVNETSGRVADGDAEDVHTRVDLRVGDKTYAAFSWQVSNLANKLVRFNERGPGPIQSLIDRLRERIRIIETDVERAFSSIAELSTGGSVTRDGGGALEVPEGYSYRLCEPDVLIELRAFFVMMAGKCDTPLELQFRDAIRAKLYKSA